MLPYRLCSHFTFAAQSLSAAAPRGAPVVAAPEIQTFVCLFLCFFVCFFLSELSQGNGGW